MIATGALRPGDRLPGVRGLSLQRRVSLSTVLAAYRRLEDRGVVEVRPQSGHYVAARPLLSVPRPEPSRPPVVREEVNVAEMIQDILARVNDPDLAPFGVATSDPSVYPGRRLNGILARIARMGLRAQRVVEGSISGLHRSPLHGVSVEFADYREYAPGDDLKRLDWRAYARSERYVIKRYEEESNLRATILLDASRSMKYGKGAMTKFDYAATLAASLQTSQSLAESVKQDEAVIHEQTARLTELVEQGRSLAADTAERLKQVQTVSEELGRAAGVKEELLTELARVQAQNTFIRAPST